MTPGFRTVPDGSGRFRRFRAVPGTPYLILESGVDACYSNGMPRIARVVAPGIPHHISQRGNRRQVTFFCDDVLVKAKPLLAEFGDWKTFLARAPSEEELGLFRRPVCVRDAQASMESGVKTKISCIH